MNSFTYYTPTKIVFGVDTEKKVGGLVAESGSRRVLVLYGGGSAVKSGLINKVEDSLKEAGIFFISKGGVKPNPLLSYVNEIVQIAQINEIDFVLAVGGGSTIDTAKAVAMGIANPEENIWDFFTKKVVLTKSIGVGVVLTIAASGSEMSDSCVITKDENYIKIGLSSDLNRPYFAVMNPENTYSLPKYQISCGVVDIMMHTLERYFGLNTRNEITNQIAEAVLKVTIKNGRIAFENSHNYDAMSEIMWCGSLSHNGLTGLGAIGDFATHRLGHELSAQYDVAHGASVTAIWGSWARYVFEENPSRFARYAKIIWGIEENNINKSGIMGIEETEKYFRSLGMPTSLKGLNMGELKDENLCFLARKCSGENTKTIGSFRILNEEDMFNIYQMANI